MKNAFIVFCSPAGSTGHVARVIAHSLEEKSIAVHLLDLGAGENLSRFLGLLKAAEADDCLFVGSPVYRDMAISTVMAFLGGLPATKGCMTVPFITWGGVNSGIALWQMGQVLQNKGYALAGAAKVLGVHSLMWQSDRPVGQGHPDTADDRQVRMLVDKVVERTKNMKPDTLPLTVLDYQLEEISTDIKNKLDQPWTIIPKTVDEEKCTKCGTCAEVCPVEAVSLDPVPVFDENCFDCFNCIRECPEEAIAPTLTLDKIEAMIRKRVETFNERPPTQIFT
ncbi:MAG: 4Fe-4S binding protein [Desulfosarcina sp.]|nr:4Fe-4S binding protein [Desulfosarcina sp.]MBC2742796.1 4Fe-4S binding protein [Desulfosarcina sp.]MBC2765706.1 4Fe-4S binding protein [Desulfosarcina sp.]